jgi:hypothetical protein
MLCQGFITYVEMPCGMFYGRDCIDLLLEEPEKLGI